MATFYLLPPRSSLGHKFAQFLDTIFPGMNWMQTSSRDLAETLAALAEGQSEVYVVYRDDVPGELSLLSTLREWYGAEPGDLVVEVADQPDQHGQQARFWRLGGDRLAA
jgi:hypothetical protein